MFSLLLSLPYSTEHLPITTTSDNDLFPRSFWNFVELDGTFRLGEKFRNIMELYNGSDGTEQLWLL